MQAMRSWWNDECGAVLSAELVIILTVVVLGMITGLACVQQAVVAELQDVGAAFRGLNQSYGFTGFRGCPKLWGRTSWTAGSAFVDRNSSCVNGACSIGLGAEIYSGPTVVAPVGPSAVPLAPKVETVVPCPPPTPSTQPLSPQPDPKFHGPDCQPCQTLPGPVVPMPMPDIPQGPVPQSLPQL